MNEKLRSKLLIKSKKAADGFRKTPVTQERFNQLLHEGIFTKSQLLESCIIVKSKRAAIG